MLAEETRQRVRPSEDTEEWARLLARHVHAHGRLFFRIAHGIVRDAAEAEDVCQSALAKAWECRGEIHDAAALKGWLIRAVTNEALRIVRRQQTAQRCLRLRAWWADSPTPRYEELETRETVSRALECLPEQTREVVVLRIMQDLSGNEVAELLGCSASEVSRRLHEGMARLREVLAERQPVSQEGTDYGV